jgi:nucleoside-diphosphate-sugar epimerase
VSRVLIAGCGYVGSTLGERLAADGDEVFALRRRTEGLPSALQPIAADLADPDALRELPALDAAVYAAAADEFREAAYRAVYVDGLRNLLQALAASEKPPRRVLYASSTSVYGQRDGEWVDEHSPTEPADFSGACVLAGERLLAKSPIPGCAVRFGGIYGPGRTGLIDRIREGHAVLPPGPPQYSNRIHRDDCAGVLRHLLRLTEPASVYVAVDCEPAPAADVSRFLAERLGVTPPGASDVPEQAGRRVRSNKRCRNARLIASGYRFEYLTYREGYAALLG